MSHYGWWITYLVSLSLLCKTLELLRWQVPKQQGGKRVGFSTNALRNVAECNIHRICLLSATKIRQVRRIGCEYDWKDGCIRREHT
jgi:hypothetical protein